MIMMMLNMRRRTMMYVMLTIDNDCHYDFCYLPSSSSLIAAVPSKRDLQALIKAIELEFSTALAEGDNGLVV